jgi:hypothetical protein
MLGYQCLVMISRSAATPRFGATIIAGSFLLKALGTSALPDLTRRRSGRN